MLEENSPLLMLTDYFAKGVSVIKHKQHIIRTKN